MDEPTLSLPVLASSENVADGVGEASSMFLLSSVPLQFSLSVKGITNGLFLEINIYTVLTIVISVRTHLVTKQLSHNNDLPEASVPCGYLSAPFVFKLSTGGWNTSIECLKIY